MVSLAELRDRRAGEAGAQPCDGKEAALRIWIKTEHVRGNQHLLRSRCREMQMLRKKTQISLRAQNTVEGLKTDHVPSGFIDRVRGKVSICSNGR